MKKVLVTGGAGFIGSHLTESLIAKGYSVRVLDNLSSGRREWIPSEAEFVQGDISQLDACHAAMDNIRGVFHCAAMSRAAPSLDSIELCTQSNVVGTQNILMAAREAGVKRFVYSGSSTYYGNQAPPHREYETSRQFLNMYALTKFVGEEYCLLFDKKFDLPCVILRYFNVYGPRQPEEGAYALVLGTFLRQRTKQQELKIHGNGQQRRDFIHVKDIVNANIAAYESNLRHQILNVGSGSNISIKELADLISKYQIYEPRRSGDAEVTLADMTRTKELLGWSPKISFEDGIKEMLNL